MQISCLGPAWPPGSVPARAVGFHGSTRLSDDACCVSLPALRDNEHQSEQDRGSDGRTREPHTFGRADGADAVRRVAKCTWGQSADSGPDAQTTECSGCYWSPVLNLSSVTQKLYRYELFTSVTTETPRLTGCMVAGSKTTLPVVPQHWVLNVLIGTV